MSDNVRHYWKCVRRRDYFTRRERAVERRIFLKAERTNSERKHLLKSYKFWKQRRQFWSLKVAEAFLLLDPQEMIAILGTYPTYERSTILLNEPNDYIVVRRRRLDDVVLAAADSTCYEEVASQNKSQFPGVLLHRSFRVFAHSAKGAVFHVKVVSSLIDDPGRCVLELKVNGRRFKVTLTKSETWALQEFLAHRPRRGCPLVDYVVGSPFGGFRFTFDDIGILWIRAFGEKCPGTFRSIIFKVPDLAAMLVFEDAMGVANGMVSQKDTYGVGASTFCHTARMCIEERHAGNCTRAFEVSFDKLCGSHSVVKLMTSSGGDASTTDLLVGLNRASIRRFCDSFSERLVDGLEYEDTLWSACSPFDGLVLKLTKDCGSVTLSKRTPSGVRSFRGFTDWSTIKSLYDVFVRLLHIWRH